MPTPRYGPAAAVVDGKIYVFGGNDVGSLDTVEEYDPDTDTWTTKASPFCSIAYLMMSPPGLSNNSCCWVPHRRQRLSSCW